MLTGDNGILTRAAEAKENTEQSQLEEQRRLASMEAATNLTETVYNYGEKEIKIPSGYAPTGIEGENKVEDGLVITDSKGNEFVWVEVPNDGTGPDYTGVEENNNIDFLKIAKALAIYSGTSLSNNLTSLAQGFLPTTNNSNHTSLLMGVQWDLVLKFIGKSGDTNSSDWGNYRDSVFNLKPGSHYAKYSSSTLSTTWKAYNEDEEGFVEASEKKELESGNGVLYTTGANTTKNSKKNICDIAGNVMEWTIERITKSNAAPCCFRGGGYRFTGSIAPASYYLYNGTGRSSNLFGFRVSLY